MLDAVAHSRPNFLPHNNDKWGSLGTHTHIVVLSNIHRPSCDWLATGCQDSYPPVPLSSVHRWLFTHRNGNMIFPTACHNSPPPPNSLWLTRHRMKWKKKIQADASDRACYSVFFFISETVRDHFQTESWDSTQAWYIICNSLKKDDNCFFASWTLPA